MTQRVFYDSSSLKERTRTCEKRVIDVSSTLEYLEYNSLMPTSFRLHCISYNKNFPRNQCSLRDSAVSSLVAMATLHVRTKKYVTLRGSYRDVQRFTWMSVTL